jgi:hypothetical protein
MILSKETGTKDQIKAKGKVVGKVMEIDKLTGIKGVTLSLGDDVNTLVLSDVGGAFIINDVEPGTYILKATMRDYKPSGEIVEVKSNGVTTVEVVLARLQGAKGMEALEKDNKELGKVVEKNGAIADTEKVEILYADPKEVKDSLEKIVTLDSIAVAGNSLILKGISDNIKTAKRLGINSLVFIFYLLFLFFPLFLLTVARTGAASSATVSSVSTVSPATSSSEPSTSGSTVAGVSSVTASASTSVCSSGTSSTGASTGVSASGSSTDTSSTAVDFFSRYSFSSIILLGKLFLSLLKVLN